MTANSWHVPPFLDDLCPLWSSISFPCTCPLTRTFVIRGGTRITNVRVTRSRFKRALPIPLPRSSALIPRGSVASAGVATADEWDEGYRRRQASNLHAELLGEGMPPSVQPFSFVPLAGLEALAASLAMQPGQTLVDLGCGQGGPGLWLADRAGAHLVGVDHSGAATAEASRRPTTAPRWCGKRRGCSCQAAGSP